MGLIVCREGRHMDQTQKRTLITVAALTLLAAGCTKKPVAVAPPPPAAAPSATSKPAPPPARTVTTQPPASTTPAPRYPSAATRARIDQLLAKIEDAYFDYNK